MSRSTDGGTTWTHISLDHPVIAVAFEGSGGIAYAGSSVPGGLYKSTDGGLTWTNLGSRLLGTPPGTVAEARSIALGAGLQAPLMIAGYCGVYKSLDGGVTFTDANAGLASIGPTCTPVSGTVTRSPAAPADFFVAQMLVVAYPGLGAARYTLDASILPPVCDLGAQPGVVTTEGGSTTLTAYCSPAATSYTWSANTGFSTSATTGSVMPSGATTYTVQGHNANGASSVQSVKVWAPGPRAANISTRAQVLTGNDAMIAGFVIDGPSSKTVVVRARGPSLTAHGVPGALANPTLQFMQWSSTLRFNDDWQSAPNAADIQASGFAPSESLESAVMMTLSPGPYTAIVRGVSNTTGVAIVEVFEVDHPETPLANISTRGMVQTGDDAMIGGFIITGSAPLQVVVRARGPSLAPFGIPNALADPVLDLYSGQSVIASNDDWMTESNAPQVQSLGFAPSNSKESAILVTLNPGAYTAVVTGAGGGTGVGIVEVFAVP